MKVPSVIPPRPLWLPQRPLHRLLLLLWRTESLCCPSRTIRTSRQLTVDMIGTTDYATGSFCSSCSIQPTLPGRFWLDGIGCAMCSYGNGGLKSLGLFERWDWCFAFCFSLIRTMDHHKGARGPPLRTIGNFFSGGKGQTLFSFAAFAIIEGSNPSVRIIQETGDFKSTTFTHCKLL